MACFHENVNQGCDDEDLTRLSYFICPTLYDIYVDFMAEHCGSEHGLIDCVTPLNT